MRQCWLQQVLIVLIGTAVMFTNLGRTRLWDRDEPRNAGCAAEMLQRGDWIVPVFNDELRAHKPVLLYWLMMSAYQVLGVTEFAARFWSALLAIGTALATYQIGRKFFSAEAGLWAGLILLTSLMFGVAGRAATPDSCLIFFTTLALLIYVQTGWDAEGHFPSSWPAAAAMYATMGLAVLAKGPVGFLLPSAVIGMYLLIVRLPAEPCWPMKGWGRAAALLRPFEPRHFLSTCWTMRPFTAVAVLAAVAGPWYAWVGIRTEGEFLRVFFLEHNLSRAAGAMEGHSGSLLYYPAAILVGFFPWSVFAAPTLMHARASLARDQRRAGFIFAGCWIGVYVGLFSLAQTKLPSYVTPCYPALALLTADLLNRWMKGDCSISPLWMRLPWIVLGLVGIGMLVGLPLATAQLLPGESWLAAIGVIPLLAAAAGLWCIRKQQPRAAAWALPIGATAFAIAVFGFALPRIDRHQQNHQLLAAIERAAADPQVGAYRCLEPTWIFYGGRPIRELATSPPSTAPADSRWQPPPRLEPGQFFAGGPQRLIVTTQRRWNELQAMLPADAVVLAEYPLFLKRERLLLIGRAPDLALRPPTSAGGSPPPVRR